MMKVMIVLSALILAASPVWAMDTATKKLFLSRITNNTRLPAIISVYEDADRNKPAKELVRVASDRTEECDKELPLKIGIQTTKDYPEYQSTTVKTLFKIEPQDVPQLALAVWISKSHRLYHSEVNKLELVYYISEVPGNKFRRDERGLSKDEDIAVGIVLNSWELPHVKLDFNIIH